MPAGKIPIIVSRDVLEGISAVRESGVTNMLDVAAVSRLAAEMDYCAAAVWIRAHRKEYAEGIFHGFIPADGEVVPPRVAPGMEMTYTGRTHPGMTGRKVRIVGRIRKGMWEVTTWIQSKGRYSWTTSDAPEDELAPLDEEKEDKS